jgi:hypothetical protein
MSDSASVAEVGISAASEGTSAVAAIVPHKPTQKRREYTARQQGAGGRRDAQEEEAARVSFVETQGDGYAGQGAEGGEDQGVPSAVCFTN